MIKHLRYLNYMMRHKYYVFLECCKLGIPWLGFIHDWSKFRPSEWFPYVNHFFGPGSQGMQTGRDKTGFYKPKDIEDDKFKFALFLHLKRNKHHWQWWVLPDADIEQIFEIPDKYLKEMIADWKGAGRAQNNPNTKIWYKKNRHNLKFGEKTRNKLDNIFLEDR